MVGNLEEDDNFEEWWGFFILVKGVGWNLDLRGEFDGNIGEEVLFVDCLFCLEIC